MNASLRLRLALLVVCSVALTVALVLYLTWQRVGETMIGMEEKNFATLLLVEEERLNTATLNHLAAKVRSVLLRKAQLRDASARIQTLLQALAPEQAAGSGQGHTVLQPLLSAMDAASIGWWMTSTASAWRSWIRKNSSTARRACWACRPACRTSSSGLYSACSNICPGTVILPFLTCPVSWPPTKAA